jgi:hypothetical protein
MILAPVSGLSDVNLSETTIKYIDADIASWKQHFNSIHFATCYIPVYLPCDSYEPGLLPAYILLGTVLRIRIHSYTEILNLTLRTYAPEHTTDYIRILYT